MALPVYALTIHADYRCRHSGRCCSTAWDVAVEVPVYRSLREALADGRLHVASDIEKVEPFITGPDLPADAGAIFQRTDDDRCVFFERGPNLCRVHGELGEQALPSTCRHFPRLALRDRRGTFITLSHFCPTAASMLFRDDVAVGVVAQPSAFRQGDYEGLIVTDDDLPPLLHPRMMMDLDAYSAWERHMVARCADVHRSPESVVTTLVRDARVLAGWQPEDGSLVERVRRLPPDYLEAGSPVRLDESLQLRAAVMRAVPDALMPEPDERELEPAFQTCVRPAWSAFSAPVNRFLAGKVFASWTAYQGQGLATIVRGVEAALALVHVEAARQCRDAGRRLDAALLLEAFRRADFTLNHLAVSEDLARIWSSAETTV
jgi:Fe-S-cluster containining protein